MNVGAKKTYTIRVAGKDFNVSEEELRKLKLDLESLFPASVSAKPAPPDHPTWGFPTERPAVCMEVSSDDGSSSLLSSLAATAACC